MGGTESENIRGDLTEERTPTSEPEPKTQAGIQDESVVDLGGDALNNPIDLTGSGKWVASSGRWWWRNSDGTWPENTFAIIDGSEYYFDTSGWMVYGWQQIDSDWYYFGSKTSGALTTGWLHHNNKWYWLDPDNYGRMVTGRFTASDGRDYIARGGGNGAIYQNQWISIDGGWYWANKGGDIRSGWLWYKARWYYLDPSQKAKMATGEVVVSGKQYLLLGDGAMFTGWRKVNGQWMYYHVPNGHRTVGWYKDRGAWYYSDAQGIMQTGWLSLNGKKYLLSSSGAMVTGWYKHTSGWLYFDSSGSQRFGWVKLGSAWYYLDPASGVMVTGTRRINGKTYRFLGSGEWINYQVPGGYLQVTNRLSSLGWSTNTLTAGMNGVKVRIVQQKLGIWYSRRLVTMDSQTINAVKAFQRRAGIPANGVVDKRTWDALRTGYSWYVDQYMPSPISVSASRQEHIDALVNYALSARGSQYTWGGAGPYNLGFDCSGLALQAMHAAGLDPQPINVVKHGWPAYRSSRELYAHPKLKHVPFGQRQRGDLVFYQNRSGVVYHVGIYLGNNQIMQTDSPGKPAGITSVYTFSTVAPTVVRPFP
ncbi:MAG: NlpC/P60 family protein [Actinomycetaceae bacterium]|nr:NlpC/P60 family protein [Arcanobacterium sp.]MDD7504640.1 NlpC/P60 family protein [Actinomycetaceae bacterium]MDY6142643.1 NlpC/P60 family protein [Arcanobacterium sp.]